MKHISATGTANFGGAVSMLILATLAVALRLAFRLHARQRFTASDGLIGLALVFAIVYYASLINYITNGAGPGTFSITQLLGSIEAGDPSWGESFSKASYLCEIFFASSISATKLSILSLYHAIFGISVQFKRFNLFMVGVVGFFWILFVFLFIFQCNPVDKAWDLAEATKYCMSSTKLLFSFEITNLFVDVVLLAMPPAMVSQLKLPREKKWSVSGVLLLGGMVCIVSIVRLYYIWNDATALFPVHVSEMQIASDVQLGLAILCACLPTYAPVLRLFRNRLKSANQSRSNKVYGYAMTPIKTAPGDKESLHPISTENKDSLDHPRNSDPFADRDLYESECASSNSWPQHGVDAV